MNSSHSDQDQSPKVRLWKRNIENFLYKTNICGICLSESEDLDNLDSIYHIETSKKDRKLKDIIGVTFGYKVSSLLPTNQICEECVTEILRSYFIVKKIHANHTIIEKYIEVLTQQATISSGTDQSIEKQLLLTIDNINCLNVPTTVTVTDKENIAQIFLCEVDDVDNVEPDFDSENLSVKYECPYCGKKFRDFMPFKEHHKLHNEAYFRCYKCGKRFKYFRDLFEHRTKVHNDILTVCDTCEIILLNSEICEHRMDRPGKFYCSKCEMNFESQIALESHNSEKHINFSCKKCFKIFNDRLKLENHRCPYKCFECKDGCVHEKYLASYQEQHMARKDLFKCPDCDFIYTTKCQIICHVNEEHLNHMPYLCDLCGENFASRPHLRTHKIKKHADVALIENDSIKFEGPIVSSVLSERPYECNSCGFCFNSEESYSLHRRKHLTEETKCHICEKSFCDIGQLNTHRKKKHPNEFKNRNIIFRCTMCPLDFKLRSDLISHVTSHPHDSSHHCRECNQSFRSKRNYISHVRKHRILYSQTCPICFKKYTKNSISRHIRMHSLDNKETIMCDVCAEVLTDEKALIKHANKHNEQRQCPHCEISINSVLYSKHVSTHMQSEKHIRSCSECDYKTKFAVCLEAHINRHHLKIRPYKCEVCSKTFYSGYTLKDHKVTHENERPEHYCHICGKRFISKKALLLHTRIHTGEQPYPCEFCDQSFLSSSRRRQHIIRKHYDPQFECQICFKKLYTQSDLRRHVGDCHDGESKRKKLKKTDGSNVANVSALI